MVVRSARATGSLVALSCSLALVLAGCSGGGGTALAIDAAVHDAPTDAAAIDAAIDAAPGALGSVTIAGPVPCPGGAIGRATCRSVVVHCPGLDDLGAVVGVAAPMQNPRGTIVLHAGGGGTGFDFQGGNGVRVGGDLVRAGFRVVQVAWATDWEQTATDGVRAAACRPATLFRWAFTDVHHDDRGRGFCALGSSGGSGVVRFSAAGTLPPGLALNGATLSGTPTMPVMPPSAIHSIQTLIDWPPKLRPN